MDDLRPEKDEVDRFQSQRSGKQSRAASSASGQTLEQGAAGSVQQGSAMSEEAAFTPPGSISDTPKPGGTVMIVLLFLCLVCAVGFLGFHVWNQSRTIDALQESLGDASNYMKQSKLLMARLEGRVYENDSELEASGSQVEKKIAFFDSEIRKLWGVAYDRNKKAIKANGDAASLLRQEVATLTGELDRFAAELSQTGKQLASVSTELDATNKRIDKTVNQLSGMDKSTRAIRKEVASLAKVDRSLEKNMDKMVRDLADLSAMQSQLGALQSQLGAVQGDVKQKIRQAQMQSQQSARSAELARLEARIKSIESAINSIDGFRRTSNDRVIRLERRVNEMKLTLRALNVTP
ncbi:MAG: hypothetical protein CSB48_07400 [Proteobacteria bacterium]|nr:MAG: hypothetical protein CSB48_07400 [Pseudomonadota bacterium]PIE40195.1 MAG: hypothetical protein CSA51_02215 [Gammaproteobacteria bacterium]